jgi:hypothetical protein
LLAQAGAEARLTDQIGAVHALSVSGSR